MFDKCFEQHFCVQNINEIKCLQQSVAIQEVLRGLIGG